MEIGRYALGKLMQFRIEQEVSQLRLSDQNYLQKLMLICIYVGQHSKMFERLGSQVLGLVDDQDGAPACGVLAIQKVFQLFEKARITSFKRLPQGHQDPLQQFFASLRSI